MASRLAEIYKSEIKTGGGLGSAAMKTLGEKIDPRRALDQSGILPTLFPSLKSYKAATDKTKMKDLSDVGLSSSMEKVIFYSELTSKNTLRLPEMARDINVMRQNIQSLVKIMGGEKVKGADMYFKTADEYEKSIEVLRQKAGIRKEKPKEISKKSEEEVKKPIETLLDPTNLVPTLTPVLKSLATVLFSPAFLASVGLGGLAYLFGKMFTSKGAFLSEEEFAGIRQAEKVGGLAGVKDELDKRKKLTPEERAYLEVKDLERFTEDGIVNAAMLRDMEKKSPEHAAAVKKYRQEKNIRVPSEAPLAATTTDATMPSAPAAPPKILSTPSRSPGPAAIPPMIDSMPLTTPTPAPQPQSLSPTQQIPSGKTSEELVNFLKEKENPVLAKQKGNSTSFWDYKQWSIGYGTKASGPNEVITEAEADRRLRAELEKSQSFVVDYGKKKGYNWNQGQIDALTSFVYNLGPGQLDKLTNGGKRSNKEIAEKIVAYNKVTQSGQLVELKGLTTRRQKELSMFQSPTNMDTSAQISTTSGTSSKPSVSTATPLTGSSVSSASATVIDGQRLAMLPLPAGTTVIDNSTKTTVASTPASTRTSSPYNEDLIKSFVAKQIA